MTTLKEQAASVATFTEKEANTVADRMIAEARKNNLTDAQIIGALVQGVDRLAKASPENAFFGVLAGEAVVTAINKLISKKSGMPFELLLASSVERIASEV